MKDFYVTFAIGSSFNAVHVSRVRDIETMDDILELSNDLHRDACRQYPGQQVPTVIILSWRQIAPSRQVIPVPGRVMNPNGRT